VTGYDPGIRTRTVARVVGPYLALMAVTLLVRQSTAPAMLSAFMLDAPLVLVAGAFTLVAGLTIVAAHHHWTGASAIVVSVIGLAATLKGASLMVAPGLGAEMTAAVARTPWVLLVAAVVMLLIGLWLSFVGWLSKA
jgi:hypothetical protein